MGDLGLIPGSGRSPGGGHSNPPRYSSLENPMDRGAWWAIVQIPFLAGSQRVGHNWATKHGMARETQASCRDLCANAKIVEKAPDCSAFTVRSAPSKTVYLFLKTEVS